MIRVAITGNIASGKTQVENILRSLGYKVIDSDKVNHDLITADLEVISEIKSTFGADIFDNNNKISKQKLGELVFSAPHKKKLLENILHKRILKKIQDFFEYNKEEKLVFAAVPLIFEAGWEREFDKIIFVSAPEELRLKRLIQRNNYNIKQAKQRIQAQESEENKIKKSDFVIYNDSDLKNLENSVLRIINCF